MEKHLVEAARSRHRLSDLVRTVTKLKPVAGGLMGLCPFHQEKTPSFHVSDIRGTFKCFGCNAWGDVFDFLMLTKGISFPDAVKELGGEVKMPRGGAPQWEIEPAPDTSQEDEARRARAANDLWLRRERIAGTLAEDYLRQTRCIQGALPAALGFLRRAYCSVLKEETGAMIAPLTDSAGNVTAVQQIFLCSETLDAWRDAAGKRVKRTIGAMRDGAVRLSMPDTVLGLAGSVEDALAAAEMFCLPVWATCGEHRMERVFVPAEINHLIIFADGDEPGARAAGAAARRHWTDGRQVSIEAPDGAKDWCEVLMRRSGAIAA